MRLKVPLILEYNGPQGWIADHWDPTPFRSLVTLCEEVDACAAAAGIIVVSEVLREKNWLTEASLQRVPVNLERCGSRIISIPGRARGRKGKESTCGAGRGAGIQFAGSLFQPVGTGMRDSRARPSSGC